MELDPVKNKLAFKNLKIVPKFTPDNPCCQFLYDGQFKSVQEHYYILDFDVHDVSLRYCVISLLTPN